MKKMVYPLVILFFVLSSLVCADTTQGKLVLDWSYRPSSMINDIVIDDLNRDGVNEVIASSRGGILYSFGDKAKSHVNFQATLTGDMKAIYVTDFDGDGKKEVLAGTDQTSDNLGIFDYQGVKKGGTLEFPYKVTSIDSADIDGDGKKDFVIGSTTKSVYAVASLKTGEKILWEYETDGQVYYVHASDLNKDGAQEVVALSLWRENEDEYAAVYAISSKGKLLWKHDIKDKVFRSASRPITAFDIDSDGIDEYVIGTMKGVLVLDSEGKEAWTYATEKFVNAVHVSVAAGSGKPVVYAGATPKFYALDAEGRLLWQAPVETTIYCIEAADLNNDGRTEVVLGSNRYVHFFSETGQLFYSLYDAGGVEGQKIVEAKNIDARAVAAGDLDGDGVLEVVVGYGWVEGRLDSNVYFGDFRVYKPVEVITIKDKGPQATTTTASMDEPATTTQVGAGKQPTTTKPSVSGEEEPSGGDASVLILLGLLIGGVIALAVLVLLFFFFFGKKKA